MRTGMGSLLCVWLLFTALPAFGQEPNAPPAEATIDVGRDGSIGHDGLVTRYWQVNHEEPAELAKELQTYVGKDVKITSKGLNTLRIDAPLEKWPIIEKLLDVLDEPAPQVFVEAKIIEIRYDTNLEFGWEGSYDRRVADEGTQPFFGSFTGAFNPESYLEAIGTDQPFQGGTFDFQTIGKKSVSKHGQYTYVFRALQSRGMVEILSQPSIIATQGKKATLTTGKRFPVQSVEVRGTQTIVTTKFEQTGIKLEIEPKLIGRSFVTLGISAEDSQIIDYVPGPEGSLNPVISERSAKSEVGVRDGETIIIGGLLSTATLEGKSGLPIVSDIPLIGYLFSSFKSQETKAELVFFITPRIIKRREQAVILPPGERARAGGR